MTSFGVAFCSFRHQFGEKRRRFSDMRRIKAEGKVKQKE